MTVPSGKIRFVLGVDPGGTSGVALLEPITQLWRAGQIPSKGAHVRGGGSFEGVMSDGAEMYLDEVAAAKEICTWATAAIKDLYLTFHNWFDLDVDADEVFLSRSKSDLATLAGRWRDLLQGASGRKAGGVGNGVEAWCDGDLGRGDLVVVEDFLLRQDVNGKGKVGSVARSGLSPARISTALMAWLEIMEWDASVGVQFKLQSASNAKGVFTDVRLKDAGGWIRGAEHARDAMRHVLLAARGNVLA